MGKRKLLKASFVSSYEVKELEMSTLPGADFLSQQIT
jgi:hypothetical protein